MHNTELNEHNLTILYEESTDFVLSQTIVDMITDSSLSERTLRFVGRIIEASNATNVIEFGSGVSTIFISGILSRSDQGRIYSIEHSTQYYRETLRKLKGAGNVTCLLSPIKPYLFRLKRFMTYDPLYLRSLPPGARLDLVLIDGPPAFRYGREAPLYQIAPFLQEGTVILLDDANRIPEKEAIRNWKRVWRSRIQVSLFPELKKGLAVIQIRHPGKMARWPFGIRDIWRSHLMTRRALMANRGD